MDNLLIIIGDVHQFIVYCLIHISIVLLTFSCWFSIIIFDQFTNPNTDTQAEIIDETIVDEKPCIDDEIEETKDIIEDITETDEELFKLPEACPNKKIK